MADHESYLLGADGVGTGHEVALVLAIVAIEDDDHAAGPQRRDGPVDRVIACPIRGHRCSWPSNMWVPKSRRK